MKLANKGRDLYSESYNTLLKTKTYINGMASHVHGLGDNSLFTEAKAVLIQKGKRHRTAQKKSWKRRTNLKGSHFPISKLITKL